MEAQPLKDEVGRFRKLFTSPLFLQRLIAVLPSEHEKEIDHVLKTYYSGKSSFKVEESASKFSHLMQLHHAQQLGQRINISRIFFRFALIEPRVVLEEQKEWFIQALQYIPNKQTYDIFYLDEWLYTISLSLPEQPVQKNSYDDQLKKLKFKMQALLTQRTQQFVKIEQIRNSKALDFTELNNKLLDSHQRQSLQQLTEAVQKSLLCDREYSILRSRCQQLISLLRSKALPVNEIQSSSIKVVRNEIKFFRRLHDHLEAQKELPFVHPDHLQLEHCASRLHTTQLLEAIEKQDPYVFVRPSHGQHYRYQPQVILLPVHGSSGYCLQAFDKLKRERSQAILIIPMYNNNLREIIMKTLAHLRWRTAKQLAGSYWITEGLSGQYTHWLHKNKSKTDEEKYFVEDYCKWLNYEYYGEQRLEPELRKLFWQYLPFPAAHCQSLSKRHPLYAQLHHTYPAGRKIAEHQIKENLFLPETITALSQRHF